MLKCKGCNGTNFKPSEGHYFCTDCGLQNHDQQEYDFEEYTQTQEKTFTNITIKSPKQDKKPNEAELTTWEEYNYILLGLVNELLDLGAKPSFKLTVLQIWTAYLRKFKVAFFSHDPLQLPRLGPLYTIKDARVIYNRKVVTIPRKRAMEPDKVLCKDKPATKKRKNKNLASAEYDVYKDVNSDPKVLDDLVPNSVEMNALPVEFSSPAKKVFKWLKDNNRILNSPMEKMPADGLLFKRGARNGRYNLAQYGSVSRRILFTILYLGLNQNKEDMQLGDMLRYIREGRISFSKAQHLLPEHLQAPNEKVNYMFNRSEHSGLASIEIRRNAAFMCSALKMNKMPVPDMKRLVQRYLEELCLPRQLFDVIEKLLVLFPSDLNYINQFGDLTPNYEGRACAYIMFALKLLFGLDDHREQTMSASAADINEAMGGEIPLFVWTEWVEFVETRKCVLAQCHYPSNAIYADSAKHSPELYLKFCTQITDKYQCNGEMASMSKKSKTKNINHIFDQLWQDHEKAREEAGIIDLPTLNFDASLTPNKSYLDEILQNQRLPAGFVPAAAKVDHSKRRIDYLLDPESLRAKCRQQGFDIQIDPAVNNTNVQYVTLYETCHPQLPMELHFLNYQHDIDENGWLKQLQSREREQETNQQRMSDRIRKDIETRRKVEAANDFGQKTRKFYEKKILAMSDHLGVGKENATLLPSSPSAKQKTANVTKQKLRKLKLVTSNFDYWLHLIRWHPRFTGNSEFKKFESKLPLNFRWLLKHFATMLEMDTKDLYLELTIVETHFSYVYQPKKKIKNSIQHSSLSNYLKNRIKNSQKLW